MSVQQACKSLKQKGADMNEHQVHKSIWNIYGFWNGGIKKW
jgi:hypothetical protein